MKLKPAIGWAILFSVASLAVMAPSIIDGDMEMAVIRWVVTALIGAAVVVGINLIDSE